MRIETINGMLHQWDTGRQVQITCDEGMTLEEVRFSHHRSPSVIRVTPDANGAADIPDELLRDAGQLTVSAVMVDTRGKQHVRSECFCTDDAVRPKGYSVGGNGGPQMVEKVLYQTDNAEFVNEYAGTYVYVLPEKFGIVAGKTFRIVRDGKTVDSVAKDLSEIVPEAPVGYAVYVGNFAYLAGEVEANTGEDFALAFFDGGMHFVSTFPATSIKISTMEEKVEGGVFAVTAESENHLDKTYAEILDAYNAGALPILRVPALNSVFTLQDVHPTGMMAFVSFTYPGGSDIRVRKIEITADDQFTYAEGFVGQSPV